MLEESEFLLGSESNVHVLVVEDDPVSSMLLQKLFKKMGIECHVAAAGDDALRMHRKHGYRLVVSDWMMPRMSGVELCKAFREEKGAYVYFILTTAKDLKEDRMQAYEAGVDGFMTKPIDREELKAMVRVAQRILGTEDSLRNQKLELEDASRKLILSNKTLTLASQRFEGLFNGLPVACFTFDEQGLIHEWNKSAEKLFGYSPYQVILRPIWDVMKTQVQDFWNDEIVSKIFEGKEYIDAEWSLVTPSGDRIYLTCNVFPLRNIGGEILGAISANVNITDRKLAEKRIGEQMGQINLFAKQLEQQQQELVQANQRLELLAVTDGLTGLWNRRRFQEDLERAFSEHKRKNMSLSLILLDIDHFKSYNDTYGHQAGDELLKQFAKTVKEISRGHEMISRYGGEEFVVTLLETSHDESFLAAERFRKAVAQKEWPHRQVTISLGISTLTPDMATPDELVRQADTALYASKGNGRNCSTHYWDLEDIQSKSA